jgi:diacylglycerol kinase family enzyme
MYEGCANFASQESYYKKHLNIIVTKKKKKKQMMHYIQMIRLDLRFQNVGFENVIFLKRY